MDTAPAIDHVSFDMKEDEDIIGLARKLVDGRHPGILTTVDRDGKPQVRWMSTLAFDDFPVFHSLTAPDTRKVGQIEHCPDVNWMFFNKNLSVVLNLVGKARVLTDTRTLKRVWRQVENKSLTYFLDQYGTGLGFVVIETTVESIECHSPRRALSVVVKPSELAPSARAGM